MGGLLRDGAGVALGLADALLPGTDALLPAARDRYSADRAALAAGQGRGLRGIPAPHQRLCALVAETRITMPVALQLDGITRRFRADSAPVLDCLRLQLEAGEYLAIMGESGSGKSTLLNLIAGLDRPDSGRVLFESTDLATLDDDALTRWRRASVGFVFQAFHVLPYLTVLQNVALPLALLRIR